jgi:hypothetical protein
VSKDIGFGQKWVLGLAHVSQIVTTKQKKNITIFIPKDREKNSL